MIALVVNAQRMCICGTKTDVCRPPYAQSGECGGDRVNCCATFACDVQSNVTCGYSAGCFQSINYTITTPLALRSSGCVAPSLNETQIPCNATCSDCVATWSTWSICSVTCRSGNVEPQQSRMRTVVTPAVGRGQCVHVNGNATRPCVPEPPICASQASSRPSSALTTSTGSQVTGVDSNSVSSSLVPESTTSTDTTRGDQSQSSTMTTQTQVSTQTSSTFNLPDAPTDGSNDDNRSEDGEVDDSGKTLSGATIGAIVGAIVAVLCCTVAVTVVIFLRVRRSRQTPSSTKKSSQPVYGQFASARDESAESMYGELTIAPPDGGTYVGIYASPQPARVVSTYSSSLDPTEQHYTAGPTESRRR
jgi:hypothetical protein